MDYEKKQEIPFGVFDSELMEATYFIPQGYHAVIEGDKVIIKKGEEPVSNDLEEFAKRESELFGEREYEIDFIDRNALTKGYYWGVKAGAQWQKEQKIDKAYDCHITKDSISELAHTVIVRNGWEIVDAREPQRPLSEEDEEMLNSFLHKLEVCDLLSIKECIWIKNKFKALKQNTWKPSDEQITVLELASKYERVFTPKQIDILIGLKEQLKKLKGE